MRRPSSRKPCDVCGPCIEHGRSLGRRSFHFAEEHGTSKRRFSGSTTPLMGPFEVDGVTEEWAYVRFVARCRQDGLCRGDLVDDAVMAKVCWSSIENVHDCSPVQGSLGRLCRCRSGKCRAGNLRIGWISKVKIPAVTPSKIVRVWSGSVRKIANRDGPPGRGRGRDDRGDIGVDDGHVASAWA